MLTDDPVGEALRALPRDQASPGFTSRTVARAGEPLRRRRFGHRWLPLAAAVALCVGLWLGVERSREQAAREARQAELAAVREEADVHHSAI